MNPTDQLGVKRVRKRHIIINLNMRCGTWGVGNGDVAFIIIYGAIIVLLAKVRDSQDAHGLN